MLIFLASLLATLPSILRSRAALELENLALRHQIGVLQRSARKRPKLILLDRLLWAALSRVWSEWRSTVVACPGTAEGFVFSGLGKDSAGPAGKTQTSL
jgi:hypothetical protein